MIFQWSFRPLAVACEAPSAPPRPRRRQAEKRPAEALERKMQRRFPACGYRRAKTSYRNCPRRAKNSLRRRAVPGSCVSGSFRSSGGTEAGRLWSATSGNRAERNDVRRRGANELCLLPLQSLTLKGKAGRNGCRRPGDANFKQLGIPAPGRRTQRAYRCIRPAMRPGGHALMDSRQESRKHLSD